MQIRSVFLGLAALALLVPGPATAGGRGNGNNGGGGGGNGRADVEVAITAPTGVYVGDPGVYSVDVTNSGGKTASAVTLDVALPATNTSPTVHVLGDLLATDPRCTLVDQTLECALGSLAAGSQEAVLFTIAFPENAAPLVVSAHADTTSREKTVDNNDASVEASLLHPVTLISVGDAAHVEHCTGTGLTSFYECELYPSSISSHDIEFQANGQIVFTNPANTTYWGEWQQFPWDGYLIMAYYDGPTLVSAFAGPPVGGDCFEGITTFDPPVSYVSPYRICL